MSEKWVEADIRVPDYQQTMNDVLLGFIKPFLEKWRGQIRYWHFLCETSPQTKQPEIRLRFFGPQAKIEDLKVDLETQLKRRESESPKVYLSHIFGAHGNPDMEFTDETGSFGQRGWSIFTRFLMDSSDTSLTFIEDEIIQTSEKPLSYYVERFFHLLMNQLGPDPIIKSVAVGPEIMSDTFRSLGLLSSWAHIHAEKSHVD